ncbi:hypothetical protein DFJ74DRAFT_663972 [Hyaloraphidium curvatum]|nr:hypothetical protein DFJ74DRAFT_663972 [Hyaloraphidium curvatum]
MDVAVEDALLVFSAAAPRPSPVFLTVEHASSRIPEPWPSPSPGDASLLQQHWGIDLGAETLAQEIAVALAAAEGPHSGEVRGVAARFSRLLCDANRNLEDDEALEMKFRAGEIASPGTMMRRTCEDGKVVVDMNRSLTLSDRKRRIDTLYRPYHAAIDRELGSLTSRLASSAHPILVLSVHSFTDMYEGRKRTLEVGVLYRDADDADLAVLLCAKLGEAGFRSAINEPWSGKEGFMHSANAHARGLGERGRALMIEARQDLLVGDAAWRKRLVDCLVATLGNWYSGLDRAS